MGTVPNAPTADSAITDAVGAKPLAGRPGAPASHGFHGGRPVRRRMASSKAAAMSPEARRQAEQVTQEMIDEFVNKGKVTKCAARWALGAVPMSLFGTDV